MTIGPLTAAPKVNFICRETLAVTLFAHCRSMGERHRRVKNAARDRYLSTDTAVFGQDPE